MLRDAVWSVVVVSATAIAFLAGQDEMDLKTTGSESARQASSCAPPLASRPVVAALPDATTAQRAEVAVSNEVPRQRSEPVAGDRRALRIVLPDRLENDVPRSLPASAAPSAFAVPYSAQGGLSASAATIRSLQGELARLGCYSGPIDGDWGPASRYAAATFTRAVNAALPTDSPDVILLALLRQTTGPVCKDLATSDIVTAATRPAWQTTIKRTDVVAAQSSARAGQASERTASFAATVDVPRVVGANGPPSHAQGPSTPSPRFDVEPSMALGVSSTEPAPSVASAGMILDGGGGGLEAPSARPRIEPPTNRQRAGQGSRRTPKRRWSQRVFQAINLDGG